MVDHLLLHCVFSWNVWCMCLRWRNVDWVVPSNVRSMFEVWPSMDLKGGEKAMVFIVFYYNMVIVGV